MSSGITKHGDERANQRGFRRSDVELIHHCGTPIEGREAEIYLVLDKDLERKIHARKKMIGQFERDWTEVNLLSVSNGESS